jgi:hypothetical protein
VARGRSSTCSLSTWALLGLRAMSDLRPQGEPNRTLIRSLSPIAIFMSARPSDQPSPEALVRSRQSQGPRPQIGSQFWILDPILRKRSDSAAPSPRKQFWEIPQVMDQR